MKGEGCAERASRRGRRARRARRRLDGIADRGEGSDAEGHAHHAVGGGRCGGDACDGTKERRGDQLELNAQRVAAVV